MKQPAHATTWFPNVIDALRWAMVFLLFSIVAIPLSSSYFSDVERTTDDSFEATEWTPDTPEMVGWNLQSQSAAVNELPVDLACNPSGTVYTNENSLAALWTAVSSPIPGENIRYIRQNIRPIGDTVTFPSSSYPNNYHSSWGSFGAGSGEYQARVQAFVDMNGNNSLDAGDFESAWSEYCSITYDPDAPELPGDPGWATNIPPASYQGDGVGMSDFVACGGTITDDSLSVRGVWGEATDALVGFDRYERQVVYNGSLVYDGTESNNYTGTFSPGGSGPNGGDGQYYVRVRAIDTLGNATISDTDWADTSTFTSWCGLTIDTTSPTSAITVTNSPTRDIEERVDNGSFEADLADWQAVGDVSVVTGSENGISPLDGSKMARVGTNSGDPATDGNSVDVNILSQDVSHLVEGNGIQSVGFWYNFATYEDGLGADSPGFMVFVGDTMVHQVWADDVQTDFDDSTLETTDWRYLSVNVADVDDPSISLAFYSGNTGDLSRQSFVYVDQVTTNAAVLNGGGEFEITGFDNLDLDQVHYWYQVGGVDHSDSGASPLTFSLTDQPDDGAIHYWATDAAGNEEIHKQFRVSFDDSGPTPVDDLTAYDDGDGNFTLEWTAVGDANPYGQDKAFKWDIRYSTSPIDPSISEADWKSLPEPTVLNEDGQPGGGLRAPLLAGTSESYRVHVDDGPATYYFGVASFDQAENWSGVVAGSLADAGAPTASTETFNPGQVVINEIMWMGSDASTADEWIELRNMTDAEVDVTGWVIENAGTSGSPDLILPSASLEANGFYLIANFDQAGSAISVEPDHVDSGLELANSGEALVLKTAGGTTIDETPAGAWAGGVNTTDKQSMERINQPGDGTDAGNWFSCDSSSCADARDDFWDSVGVNYGTPGAANLSFHEEQIESEAELVQLEEDVFKLQLTGIQMFTQAEYTLTYIHQVEGESVTDAVSGSLEFDENTRELETEELYAGTCSTNGEVCVTHAPVSEVEVEVVLTGPGVPDRIITARLELE